MLPSRNTTNRNKRTVQGKTVSAAEVGSWASPVVDQDTDQRRPARLGQLKASGGTFQMTRPNGGAEKDNCDGRFAPVIVRGRCGRPVPGWPSRRRPGGPGGCGAWAWGRCAGWSRWRNSRRTRPARPASAPSGMCVYLGPAVPVTSTTITAPNRAIIGFTVKITNGRVPAPRTWASHTSPRSGSTATQTTART